MKQTNSASRDATIGILPQFLYWYFIERPKIIVKTYTLYARAFGEVFSLVYMIKTFISPWKSIKDEYPAKGFNLEMIMETLTLNVTARVIGMIFRTFAILTGIVIQCALITGFSVYLAVWVSYPILVIGGFVVLFSISG